ncbi:phenylacetic acid degradation protein PaaN [Microbulbifer spongiae]|uniref:Phenylacetic acid degradation protein PaaN n=1 Tax=Microbulbifer spongiae TaxID=2944933 RepID=A0ABY9EG66_9GAMM|nr:phenylacetic acid degradation protein PaaN [Microbulbifer sp. MI-G]WKD51520.1 phenylacetic acid degradation protein PaaN [Microbulbifer sp. MI-G]
MATWFQQHRDKFNRALDACKYRYAWSAYPESPSSRIHGTQAAAAGRARFEALLNNDYPLTLPGEMGRVGAEVSPYTGAALGIRYPKVDIDAIMSAAQAAIPPWRDSDVETRVGVCLEILERCAGQLFENAHATMHTAGQSFIMAFAGSGANALDRGLEALVYAYKAMADVPTDADWQRQFGKDSSARLTKHYKLMPRGPSVNVCCATFPLWNGYPALCASLATGNPVIFKPHPNAILPVALVVSVCREVLAEAGFSPDLVSLVTDTRAQPATTALLQHPATAIIDFTGSPHFGQWIETHCRHAQVYTETAGCNAVVMESCQDMAAMCRAVAQSLCQASAQMCTSVQNIHIPAQGIVADGRPVSYEQLADALVAAVEEHLAEPRQAALLCGALVNDGIYATLEKARALGDQQGQILRNSTPYAHPEYPSARTATPLMIALDQSQQTLYSEEFFGPVSFLIKGPSAESCLAIATDNARRCGAIASHVYSINEAFLNAAQDAFNHAGVSVACNLTGMPINFAAAYSDYHVTGLNPAGSACLTDLAFVANRFRIVQRKTLCTASGA